jgi:hypothetical protein
MVIAGSTYRVYLWPQLLSYSLPWIVGTGGVLEEMSLVLWLLVFGNPSRRSPILATASLWPDL